MVKNVVTKNVIVYVGGFELPDKNAAAQRVLANAKIFRDLDYRVVFIGIDKSLPEEANIQKAKSNISGFESWVVPYPKSKKFWLKYITTCAHIERIVNHYYKDNVYGIICYNYPFVAQFNIRKMCHKYDIFYIADATEWYESTGGGLLFRCVKWLDTNLRMRFLHPKANGIITTSRYLSDFYNKKNCITVELPTLFDIDCLNTDDAKFNQSNELIKFMYAGAAFNPDRINRKRTNIKDRLDKIITLFDKLYKYKTNFKLDIYGLTLENYMSVFPEHDAIMQRLSKKIVFHGRKSHSEIIAKIKESDFTIFLRNIDRVVEAGFPSKFSESVSCGTPVIANKISNIEVYIVEGKNCFLISLDDSKKQLQKMIEVLNLSQGDLLNMKQYCLQNKVFSYKNYVKPVENFLLKIEGEVNAKHKLC